MNKETTLELLKDVWELFPDKSLTEILSMSLDYRIEYASDELLEQKLKDTIFQNM